VTSFPGSEITGFISHVNYRNFFYWEISVFHCCHVIIKDNIHLMTQCGEIHAYLSGAGVTDTMPMDDLPGE
jgi:hypothetical protein